MYTRTDYGVILCVIIMISCAVVIAITAPSCSC